MRGLNWYLGVLLTALVTYVVIAAVQTAISGGTGAAHLVDLAKAIFSLPLFAGATLVWLGGTYKPEIAALISRVVSSRGSMSAAAAADAHVLSWIATYGPSGVVEADLRKWLTGRGLADGIHADLLARGWVSSPQSGHVMLSAMGGEVLRQWMARAP